MPITGMHADHWEHIKTKATENGLSIEIVVDRFRLLRGEHSFGLFDNTAQLYNFICGYECVMSFVDTGCTSPDKKEN